ncbi:hypothetical protein ON010_g5920 [Phytophthora cinnamomi]|nr:hypothetical protein ON010_g5920 [Phytophthora cinnamomi]
MLREDFGGGGPLITLGEAETEMPYQVLPGLVVISVAFSLMGVGYGAVNKWQARNNMQPGDVTSEERRAASTEASGRRETDRRSASKEADSGARPIQYRDDRQGCCQSGTSFLRSQLTRVA